MISTKSIIGLFDMDNTTWSFRTRGFLERAESEGRVIPVGDDLPKSFVLCQEGQEAARIYITQLNTATLLRRMEQNGFE